MSGRGSAVLAPAVGTSWLRRTIAGAGWAVALYAVVVRPWHLCWGATEDEVRRPLPGDDLVATPTVAGTRAVTVDAPPAHVWPWLVQQGYGRAGWYAPGRPVPRVLRAAAQRLGVLAGLRPRRLPVHAQGDAGHQEARRAAGRSHPRRLTLTRERVARRGHLAGSSVRR